MPNQQINVLGETRLSVERHGNAADQRVLNPFFPKVLDDLVELLEGVHTFKVNDPTLPRKPNAGFPRLAGQLYWYMVYTLSIWGSERGQGGREDISWIMRPTVANLTPKQVQALAEYVSTLR